MNVRIQRVVVVTLVAFVLKLLIQNRVQGAQQLPLELIVLYDAAIYEKHQNNMSDENASDIMSLLRVKEL